MRCTDCTRDLAHTQEAGSTPVDTTGRRQAPGQGPEPHLHMGKEQVHRTYRAVGRSKDTGWASWDIHHRSPWGNHRMKGRQRAWCRANHTVHGETATVNNGKTWMKHDNKRFKKDEP